MYPIIWSFLNNLLFYLDLIIFTGLVFLIVFIGTNIETIVNSTTKPVQIEDIYGLNTTYVISDTPGISITLGILFTIIWFNIFTE